MDSKTYIAGALRTESVPEELNINEVGLHAMLEIGIAAGTLLDQAKRRLYYNSATKTVLLDRDKMLDALQRLHGMVTYLGYCVETGIDLDNRLSLEQLLDMQAELPEEVRSFHLDKLDVRLTHAALGCFTEAAELLEPIKAQYETGAMDRVNFGEEIGDLEWYQAIGFNATGVTEASVREKNIAKLKKRYPEKFTSDAAVTRDLAAERTILEKE